MKKLITETLTAKPSYLRWSPKRLAEKFGCSEKTTKSIKAQLKDTLKEYNSSMNNHN